MKIRSGFVSNSSSSSFVLKGFVIDKNKFNLSLEAMKSLGFEPNNDDIQEYLNDGYSIEDYMFDIGMDNFKCYLKKDMGLYIGTDIEDGNPRDNTLMIGEMIMEDDEFNSFETMELDLEPSQKLLELKEKLGIDENIKLICGTRCC